MLENCPEWLKKWTAITLKYMQAEEKALPAELINLTDKIGRPMYISMDQVMVGVSFRIDG